MSWISASPGWVPCPCGNYHSLGPFLECIYSRSGKDAGGSSHMMYSLIGWRTMTTCYMAIDHLCPPSGLASRAFSASIQKLATSGPICLVSDWGGEEIQCFGLLKCQRRDYIAFVQGKEKNKVVLTDWLILDHWSLRLEKEGLEPGEEIGTRCSLGIPGRTVLRGGSRFYLVNSHCPNKMPTFPKVLF